MNYKYSTFGVLLLFSVNVVAVDFVDIDNSLYRESINELSSNDIIDGYSDETFRPNIPINRAEFLKILLESKFKLEVSKFKNDEAICFTDMPTFGIWYKSYACVAKELDIISGFPDGTLRASNNVNKAEAAKILHNVYFGNIESKTTPWHLEYFNELKSREIFLDIFEEDPEKYLTRGEMAFAIDQFDNYPNHILKPVIEVNKYEISPLYVVPADHPGQEVTGGYISSYDQWQAANFLPNLANYTETAENKEIALEVLESVNDYRAFVGASLMRYDEDLQKVAQNFAGHLVINAIYSHSDKLGQDPFERAKKANISGFVAESMVWRKQDPIDAINWWKKSDIHVRNIMNERFVRAGVGVAKEPNGGYIIILFQGE